MDEKKEGEEGEKREQSEEKPMYAVQWFMPICVILYSTLTNALSLSVFS